MQTKTKIKNQSGNSFNNEPTPIKILNLFAGIGENRKNWKNVEVTAVECNEEMAMIYKAHFPDDTVIVADSQEFLLKNNMNFDFIISSPPCQTPNRTNPTFTKQAQKARNNFEVKYPDMKPY
jgi:DNA (cytosine-5)-methyltransferase 1